MSVDLGGRANLEKKTGRHAGGWHIIVRGLPYVRLIELDSVHVNAAIAAVTFFFHAEDGIRVHCVTGVQTCALPICRMAVVVAGSHRDESKPRTKQGQ